MIFQTVPIILRNPSPLGFGENAVSSGNVVLPFALVFLVFGPTSGYIITKLGSLKPIIFGSIIATVVSLDYWSFIPQSFQSLQTLQFWQLAFHLL